MPFDGIVARCIANELSDILPGGRVEKIHQPEIDEIILNIRAGGRNYKLLLSASSTHPRIHFTEISKENPANPPVFCMLLRKHLSGGKITGIGFQDYERIVTLHMESTNELGDTMVRKLVIEIMGRHSNIILVNHDDRIIDAIKHIDSEISSVREVMPARPYILPPAQDKTNPEQLDAQILIKSLQHNPDKVIEKYLLDNIKGFSPLLCREICFRAGIDGRMPASGLDDTEGTRLKTALATVLESIKTYSFKPCLIYEDSERKKLLDFHCLEISLYGYIEYRPAMSAVLDTFYCEKDRDERLKQKRSGILKVLNTSIERCSKKLALQQEKLREVADRENLRLYGELILANIHSIPQNIGRISLPNYYSQDFDSVEIPLDENLSPQKNAQRYFKQYTKAKSAFTYTSRQLEETLKEMEYLESARYLLDNCVSPQEIDEVRQELREQGYITAHARNSGKRQDKMSSPFHYRSTDEMDIFAGKNNRQNDLLTLKTSSSGDIWLHTRNIPGSHVIIRKNSRSVPDKTLFEAAVLAAYHSKSRLSSNVPVDYTEVKNVKKPPGAKPGMVIYNNFKTVIVTPDENLVKKLAVRE